MPALEHAALFPDAEVAIAETLKQILATHPRLDPGTRHPACGRKILIQIEEIDRLLRKLVVMRLEDSLAMDEG
jgi:hypothetical protein